MRLVLAFLVALHLCTGSSLAAASQESLEDQLGVLALGTPVEVRLVRGGKLRGALTERTESSISIRDAKGEQRTIAYQDVKSFKTVKTVRKSHVARNILIGVGVGFGVLIVVAAAGGLPTQ